MKLDTPDLGEGNVLCVIHRVVFTAGLLVPVPVRVEPVALVIDHGEAGVWEHRSPWTLGLWEHMQERSEGTRGRGDEGTR